VKARGTIVSAAPGRDAEFVSRFFAPAVGVPEDPVTGSAHCTLAPYWAALLGREAIVGAQLSARGGRVAVRLADGRVRLSGRAITVVRGTLAD
jgi:predicted PhzF superfamily epimerase YddE/YHI9